MTFLAPWWLVGIPLLVLGLLARGVRERVVVLGDQVLWARAAARAQRADGRRRRIEQWWWALPAALILCALAGPMRVTRDPGVILLDRSTGGDLAVDGSTRLGRALAAARARFPDADVRGWPPPERDADLVRACGREIPMEETAAAAASLAAEGRPVVLATWRASAVPPGVGAFVVADRVEHAAITAAWTDASGRPFVRIAGTPGAGPRELVLRDAAGVPLRRWSVPDAAAATVEWSTADAPSVRRLVLEPADANPDDDVLGLGDLGATAPLRVSVRPGTPSDLVRALRAQGETVVAESKDPDADLCVGFLGRRGSLLLPSGDWPNSWRLVGEAQTRTGLAGTGGFAALGDAAATVGGCREISGAESAEIVMQAGGRPLAGLDGARAFLLADPAQGDWATRAVFPRLVAGLVARVTPRAGAPWVRCGTPISVRVDPRGDVRTEFPDGGVRTLAPTGGVVALASERPGPVIVTDADGRRSFFAWSVLSASAIVDAARAEVVQPVAPGVGETRRDLSPIFFVLAAALAAGLAFRRR